jgi:hypothetical protein
MAACDKEVRIETGNTLAMREILLKRFSVVSCTGWRLLWNLVCRMSRPSAVILQWRARASGTRIPVTASPKGAVVWGVRA